MYCHKDVLCPKFLVPAVLGCNFYLCVIITAILNSIPVVSQFRVCQTYSLIRSDTVPPAPQKSGSGAFLQ